VDKVNIPLNPCVVNQNIYFWEISVYAPEQLITAARVRYVAFYRMDSAQFSGGLCQPVFPATAYDDHATALAEELRH